MVDIKDISRPIIIQKSEVGDKTVAAAGAGALAMARPLRVPTPAPQPALVLVPEYVPPQSPATAPSRLPGFVRWGGVWGVAMSIPGDSSPAYMRELRRLTEHEDGLQRELDGLKKQREDVQRETGQKWYWGSDELFRLGRKLATLDLKINRIELMIEWIQLQQEKVNGDFLDSSAKFDNKYRLEEIEQELAALDINGNVVDAKYRRRGGIKASADGDVGGAAPAEGAETKKSDPKEWQDAAAASDVAGFVNASDRRVAAFNVEVLMRIQNRQSSVEISKWFETVVRPELAALNEASLKLSRTPLEAKQLHDARNRRTVLYIRVSPLLKQNRLEEVASICNPPASSLEVQARALKDKFGDQASFEFKGLAGIHLAPHMDPDGLAHILENLVLNAIQHPRRAGDKVHIVFEYNSGILFVTDDGAGMNEETLEGLRQGKRIHDGVEIVDDNAESHGHGYGVGEAFRHARLLAADLDYASEEGVGTTVSFTPLPGGFVPDPAEFILSERGNFTQMEMLVSQMSDANRMRLLHDLAKILYIFADEVLPELQRATDKGLLKSAATPPDLEALRRRAHVVVDRYTKYLDVVASNDLEGFESTEQCRRVLKILTELLRNISKTEGSVLYLQK